MQTLWRDPAMSRCSARRRARPRHRRRLHRRPEAPPGPRRTDRAKEQFEIDLENYATVDLSKVDAAVEGTFPASDPTGAHPGGRARAPTSSPTPAPTPASQPTPLEPLQPGRGDLAPTGRSSRSTTASVGLAALTSCTNTSNPSVMIAAGLLARTRARRASPSKPWVKTNLAPGSKVVTDYYAKAGSGKYLEELGFDLVGYGCTTCIGNSGPLDRGGLRRRSTRTTRGHRGALRQPQLRGPHQPRREDELPRQPAAGRRLRAGRIDGLRLRHRPAGQGQGRQRRVPARTSGRLRRGAVAIDEAIDTEMFTHSTPTSSRATSAGSRCRPRRATPSTGTRTRPTSASPRSSTA